VELLADLALSLLVSHKSGVNLLDDIDLFLRAWHQDVTVRLQALALSQTE